MNISEPTIIQALKDCLDNIQGMTSWIVLLCLSLGIGILSGREEIEGGGIKLKRIQAFWPYAFVMSVVSGGVWIGLERIRSLLALPSTASTGAARFEVLALHKWLMNPFSFFGSDRSSQFHAAVGQAILILIWWGAMCMLYVLADIVRGPIRLAAIAFFGSLVFLAILSANDIHSIQSSILHDSMNKVAEGSSLRLNSSQCAVILGLFGLVITVCLRELQKIRFLAKRWNSADGFAEKIKLVIGISMGTIE